MKDYSVEEVEKFVVDLWDKNHHDWRSPDVKVKKFSGGYNITFSAMYESPSGPSFDTLMELCKFFDTTDIHDHDHFSYGGCETCDYGSSYGFTLTVKEGQTWDEMVNKHKG